MGCLSLKATIGALTATTVIVVAAVCLGITLTVSLNAIRDIGKGNANALVKGAYAGLQQHFANPAHTAEYIQERALAERWVWPSYNQANASVFRDRAVNAVKDASMMHRLSTDRFNLFWADGSRAGAQAQRETDTLELENSTATPGAILAQGNRSYYNLSNSRPLPDYSGSRAPFVNYIAIGAYPAMAVRITDNTTGLWIPPIALAETDGRVSINYPGLIPLRGGLPNSGALVGILYISLRSDMLKGFLLDVKATPNTESMLYDRTRLVVATTIDFENQETIYSTIPDPDSLPAGCLSVGGQRNAVRCLPYISNLSVPAFDAVSSDEAFLFNTGDATVRLVKADGGYSYVAQAFVRKPLSGLDLFVMLQVPEKDVIGDVVQGRNLAIGITCAILVVAVAIAVALIVVLLAPLTEVAERMSHAATLEDDLPFEDRSAMAEIAQLEDAYGAMNRELQRLKAFVPQSLLRAGADSEDADLEGSVTQTNTVDDSFPSRPADIASAASHRSRRSMASRRTKQSGGRSSDPSSTGAVGAGLLNTTTSLKKQRVTVMCLNTLGFNKSISDRGFGATVEAVANMTDAVSTAVLEHRGVIDAFHGDRFTATFNAAHTCAGHQRKAVHCALRIAEELSKAPHNVVATAGIASGDALVGNVGSTSLKHFSVLGSVLPQAGLLERLAKLYPDAAPHVILAPSVAKAVTPAFVVQPVDVVRLPGAKTEANVISVAIEEAPHVAGQGQANATNGDGGQGTWMYDAKATNWRQMLISAFNDAAEAPRGEALPIARSLQRNLDLISRSVITKSALASVKRLLSACDERTEADKPVGNRCRALATALVQPGFVDGANDEGDSPDASTTQVFANVIFGFV